MESALLQREWPVLQRNWNGRCSNSCRERSAESKESGCRSGGPGWSLSGQGSSYDATGKVQVDRQVKLLPAP
jgi:hypothetical protein